MINDNHTKLEFRLHLLVWLVLFSLPLAFSIGSDINWKDLFRHFWMHLFVIAILFYANYLYLISLFFEKNKYAFCIINLIFIL